jgi:spore coat protein CotH
LWNNISPLPDNDTVIWKGEFEYEYPNEIAPDWTNIYNLVQFVNKSSDTDFYSQYSNRFIVDNLVDYYIFLNMLRLKDNNGNNTFYARYRENEPYFQIPWDLDQSIGSNWDGSPDSISDGLLSNRLYDRLLSDYSNGGFVEKVREKYSALRNEWLTTDSLMDLFMERI